MNTRSQTLAARIYPQIARINEEETDGFKSKYGTMAQKLPVLIRTAGLAQAIAFVAAKGKSEKAWKQLLTDLGEILECDLVEESRTVPLSKYRTLTRNTLDALLWYKRFSQSVLDVVAGGEED